MIPTEDCKDAYTAAESDLKYPAVYLVSFGTVERTNQAGDAISDTSQMSTCQLVSRSTPDTTGATLNHAVNHHEGKILVLERFVLPGGADYSTGKVIRLNDFALCSRTIKHARYQHTVDKCISRDFLKV